MRIDETGFSATVPVEADVEISAEELEEAGWFYIGAGAVPTRDSAVQAIAAHHDDHHEGAQRFCREPLCQAVTTG